MSSKQTEMSKPKPAKVTRIQKFALMSPFLTYAEVVPSKPAKEIVVLLKQHLLMMS
jgi:hypothetical protein